MLIRLTLERGKVELVGEECRVLEPWDNYLV